MPSPRRTASHRSWHLMTFTSPASDAPSAPSSGSNSTFAQVENSVAEIGALVERLDPPPAKAAHENRLVEVRLGIASSLFTALRHKHPATADHSLRVALGCSSWAFARGLDSDAR